MPPIRQNPHPTPSGTSRRRRPLRLEAARSARNTHPRHSQLPASQQRTTQSRLGSLRPLARSPSQSAPVSLSPRTRRQSAPPQAPKARKQQKNPRTFLNKPCERAAPPLAPLHFQRKKYPNGNSLSQIQFHNKIYRRPTTQFIPAPAGYYCPSQIQFQNGITFRQE